VVVHLVDFLWKEGPLEDAVAAALREVEGAYGIAVISSRDPGKIVVARNGSPLLIGVGQNGEMLAGSDAAAVIELTRDVVYLDDDAAGYGWFVDATPAFDVLKDHPGYVELRERFGD
jgi:glucosamine--fructose-6-phosphate aminotransferase (isomerizing)